MSGQGSSMQLSLIVRGQHPPGDTAAHLRDDLELVKRADEVGFDGIVKGSHYSAHPFQSVQQIPFLAYAAAIAPRLRLICGLVLLPLHKPLDLAEQLATLDILSNGKLVFGCGIGYRDVEFKAFGVPRAGLGKRFEEGLEAVKRLWTEDFVTMKGSHFELDGATCTIKPVQQPMPRARRVQAAVSGGSADAARSLCRTDPRRGDPPGPALPRREIQSLSRLGAGQGDAQRRRFRPRFR